MAKKYPNKFDPQVHDKDFIRMILHQMFGSGDTLKEIWSAWVLRDWDVNEVNKLEKHMLELGLLEESGEPDHFRLSDKGNDWLNGNDDD